jgi:hypothetical protein
MEILAHITVPEMRAGPKNIFWASKKLESLVQMAEWWPNHFATFFFKKKTSDINI